MEDWTIAVIAVACAVGAGLIVGITVYVVLDRRRKRRGNHDPYSIPDNNKTPNTAIPPPGDLQPGSVLTGPPGSRGSVALDSLSVAELNRLSSQQLNMLNIPYQRYSLNIGGGYVPPKILNGNLLQPSYPQMLTLPPRGPSYFPTYSSSVVETPTFPPPKNLANHRMDDMRVGARGKASKNQKISKSGRSPSEIDLRERGSTTGVSNPNFMGSSINSHAYSSAAPSYVSGLSTEPLYQARKPPPTSAAVKNEVILKKERKDLRHWNSLGNLNESEGEAEFSDRPRQRGGNTRPGHAVDQASSAQPYSMGPYSNGMVMDRDRARPPSFKHYSKYSDDQAYYNAARAMEEVRHEWSHNAGNPQLEAAPAPAPAAAAAAGPGVRLATELSVMRGPLNTLDVDAMALRAKHSSLIVGPTHQDRERTDTDMLAFGYRDENDGKSNWVTRAAPSVLSEQPTSSNSADKYANANGRIDESGLGASSSQNANAKPLARILPSSNANGSSTTTTDAIYSKVMKNEPVATTSADAVRRTSSTNRPAAAAAPAEASKQKSDAKTAADASKTGHGAAIRNTAASPTKSYLETPTRDLQAVNDAFDFLNAMNV